jgi:hypothetical protein
MEWKDLVLTGFGDLTKLAEFFGIIEGIDRKISKLLCADLEYAKKQLTLLPGCSEENRIIYVRKAGDAFCRAISQVDGTNRAIAYLGHAWCLVVLKESTNAIKELRLLTEIETVPRETKVLSCVAYYAFTFLAVMLALVPMIIVPFFGILFAIYLLWLFYGQLFALLESTGACNQDAALCHMYSFAACILLLIVTRRFRIFRGLALAIGNISAFVEKRFLRFEGVLIDEKNANRLRMLPFRKSEKCLMQLKDCARELLTLINVQSDSR